MRYLVIGTSGAGKSTFAKRLAHKIHASYIELDSRY
jgi:adenylate kinase family enzyme